MKLFITQFCPTTLLTNVHLNSLFSISFNLFAYINVKDQALTSVQYNRRKHSFAHFNLYNFSIADAKTKDSEMNCPKSSVKLSP
jgi:hypothetical protein